VYFILLFVVRTEVKTLLVLISARQQTAISRFHVRRPTLMIVRSQSPGQRHGTDYQQQSLHLTLCRIWRTNWKLTFSDEPFLFPFHSSQARAPFNDTPYYGP